MDASALSDELSDYDVISDPGHRSWESSVADILGSPQTEIHEPSPSEEAQQKFPTTKLSPQDIQNNVRSNFGTFSPIPPGTVRTRGQILPDNKLKRVYVDGSFDGFNVAHALQLRQAKLSFPAVHLIVGVFSNEACERYGYLVTTPLVERCELLRHCRWVDEVLQDAPWQIDESFTHEWRIDYVVFDEGATVSPAYDKFRVRGYDSMKRLGKVVLTKPTPGILIWRPVSAVSVTPALPLFSTTEKVIKESQCVPETATEPRLVEFE
ncbi:hypothetical protein E1B28_007271 [Marasmius oreades]|uniref:choline-phosphate cytidylyltransferase n=1 Tax=Marasmius oreades TaxID=181124 RepID=A0A9P7UTV4_9AGAR|nr:uncharacterized protein E1B28_007271 [Marasmius oreades]KAG7093605.1 hypothetical protein E1B28_007271 [Marasmius oreades]